MITAEEANELYKKSISETDCVPDRIKYIERRIIFRSKRGYNSAVIKHAFSFNGKVIKILKESGFVCRIENDNLYIIW